MHKGYAIFCLVVSSLRRLCLALQEVVSLREVLRLWRVTATE